LAAGDVDLFHNFNSSLVECEKENEYIYKFFGTMKINEKTEPLILDVD